MSDRIRVLQVLASLNVGGAESRMMDVYRKIDRSKFSFDFLSLSEEGYFKDEILSMGGKVISVAYPHNLLTHFFELRSIIKQNGPYDAVHAHTSHHCGLVALAAFTCGVPVRIAHARTTSSHKKTITAAAMVGIGRFLIRYFANYRIAISDKAASYLFGKKWYKLKNTVVIKNAIDTSNYKLPLSREDAIKGCGISSPEGVVVGHVGRFSPIKNHAFLVDLFFHLRETMPGAKLIMVGKGPTMKSVAQQIEKLEMKDAVIMPGLQSNVFQWMKIFDVAVIPSFYEGLCNVVIEAQLSGVPCVVSDGIPKKETDLGLEMTEYLPLDAGTDAWIAAINRALKKDIPPYSVRVKALQENGYDLEAVVMKYADIYSGIF